MMTNITIRILEVFVYASGGASVGFACRAAIDAYRMIG